MCKPRQGRHFSLTRLTPPPPPPTRPAAGPHRLTPITFFRIAPKGLLFRIICRGVHPPGRSPTNLPFFMGFSPSDLQPKSPGFSRPDTPTHHTSLSTLADSPLILSPNGASPCITVCKAVPKGQRSLRIAVPPHQAPTGATLFPFLHPPPTSSTPPPPPRRRRFRAVRYRCYARGRYSECCPT